MPARAPSSMGLKAACSVSELAERCGLSRARWYELVKSGVMPQPCYCVHTRRPLYPRELQELAITLRMTNSALDGRYVLFYNRREQHPLAPPRASSHTGRRTASVSAPDRKSAELIEALRTLGIDQSEAEIKVAITHCYPGGLPDDFEMGLTTVFRHMRRLDRAR